MFENVEQRNMTDETEEREEICMPESAALTHLDTSHSDDVFLSHYHIHNVCIKDLVYESRMKLR